MRLAHHPEAVERLRTPSVDAPWRVLLSGCIAGLPCGVDGSDYGMAEARPIWLSDERVVTLSFCPEDYGLGTPRAMPDLHGGDGFDVLDARASIRDEHGLDLSAGMLKGAFAMRDFATREQVDFAILTDRSAACGSQVISLGCRYEAPVIYRRGVGVAAAALIRAGIPLVSQRDYRTLGLLGMKLDVAFAPSDACVDHHRSPWVCENLP